MWGGGRGGREHPPLTHIQSNARRFLFLLFIYLHFAEAASFDKKELCRSDTPVDQASFMPSGSGIFMSSGPRIIHAKWAKDNFFHAKWVRDHLCQVSQGSSMPSGPGIIHVKWVRNLHDKRARDHSCQVSSESFIPSGSEIIHAK
jgi:hypothetical protein